MKIDYSSRAGKSLSLLEKSDKKIARTVARKIAALTATPFPPGARKLDGEKFNGNSWRIKIGKYRVVYEVNEDAGVVRIARAEHRSKVYD